MILLFLFLICPLFEARTITRSISAEKPFMAKNDIFSNQFVQTISETELEKELKASQEHATKEVTDGTAMPPGYGPQPPGTTVGEAAVHEAETSTIRSKEESVVNTSDQVSSPEVDDPYGGPQPPSSAVINTLQSRSAEAGGKEKSTEIIQSNKTVETTTSKDESENSTTSLPYDLDSIAQETIAVFNRSSITKDLLEGSGMEFDADNSTALEETTVKTEQTTLSSTVSVESSSEEFEGSGITWEERIKQTPTQVSGEVGCESAECSTKAMHSSEISSEELVKETKTTEVTQEVTETTAKPVTETTSADSSDSATVDAIFGFDGSVEVAGSSESQNETSEATPVFEVLKQFSEENEKPLEATLIPEINQTDFSTISPNSPDSASTEDDYIFAKADGLSAEMERANTTVSVEASFKETVAVDQLDKEAEETTTFPAGDDSLRKSIENKHKLIGLRGNSDETVEKTTKTPKREFKEEQLSKLQKVQERSQNKEEEHEKKPQNRRGVFEGCPTPSLCAKNCFIALDENGCQTCQCLWQASTCDVDSDCPESIQFCDLGRCECRDGYEQDMKRSGFCKEFGAKSATGKLGSSSQTEDLAIEGGAAQEAQSGGYGEESVPPASKPELAVEGTKSSYGEEIEEPRNNHPALGVAANPDKYSYEEKQKVVKKPQFPKPSIPAGAYFGLARNRRSAFRGAEKPRSAERLQWPEIPGPCDSDDHCSAGLYCIEGDCWELQDKPVRSQHRNTIPESFIISSEDDADVETRASAVKLFQVDEKLAPTPKPRDPMRFVTADNIRLPTNTQLERTTVSTSVLGPRPFAPNQMIQMKQTVVRTTDAPDLGMSTVKEIHSTTRVFRVHTTPQPPSNPPMAGFSSFSSEGQPPAEPEPSQIGIVSRAGINRQIPDLEVAAIPPTFTKMIELPPEVEFKKVPIKKETSKPKKKHAKTRKSLVVDSSQFPITARMLEMERDGKMNLNGALALAEEPTKEELQAHENLLRALAKQVKLKRSKARLLSSRRAAGVKNTNEVRPIPLEEKTISHEAALNRRQFESVEPQLKKSLEELRELGTTGQVVPTLNFNTPSPAPSKQLPGIWYPMMGKSVPPSENTPWINKTRSPIRSQGQSFNTKDGRGKRPIRVEGTVTGSLPDECSFQADCGSRSNCCRKQWCDSSAQCGISKFCLPTCLHYKLVFFPQRHTTTNDFLYD